MGRILVVDDEENVAKTLSRFLRRAGFGVEIAGNGAEALARLDTFVPDLVISDLRMPGMNGNELLTEVQRRLPGAACLLMTGFSDLVHGVRSSAEMPAVQFPVLDKPWKEATLLDQVRSLIGAA